MEQFRPGCLYALTHPIETICAPFIALYWIAYWTIVPLLRLMFYKENIGVTNSTGGKMSEFKFRLPWLLGIVLSVVFSLVFPAQKASALTVKALQFDLPQFLGMPIEQALMFLVGSAVLGAIVVYVLGQFNVAPDQAQYVTSIIVAIATAAMAAGLKFVPPEIASMSVWQALVAVFGFLASLGGVRAGVLVHNAQLKAQ